MFFFQIEDWINTVDFDNGGKISYEEFKYSIIGNVANNV